MRSTMRQSLRAGAMVAMTLSLVSAPLRVAAQEARQGKTTTKPTPAKPSGMSMPLKPRPARPELLALLKAASTGNPSEAAKSALGKHLEDNYSINSGYWGTSSQLRPWCVRRSFLLHPVPVPPACARSSLLQAWLQLLPPPAWASRLCSPR